MSPERTAEESERHRHRRRAIGLMMILVSIALVLVGELFLGPRLHGWGYILYWGACAVFTVVALFTALVDMVVVRREAAREERRLLQETFGKKEAPRANEEKPKQRP